MGRKTMLMRGRLLLRRATARARSPHLSAVWPCSKSSAPLPNRRQTPSPLGSRPGKDLAVRVVNPTSAICRRWCIAAVIRIAHRADLYGLTISVAEPAFANTPLTRAWFSYDREWNCAIPEKPRCV